MSHHFEARREQLYKTLFKLYKEDDVDLEILNSLLSAVKCSWTIEDLDKIRIDLNYYMAEQKQAYGATTVDDLIYTAYTNGILKKEDAISKHKIIINRNILIKDINIILNELSNATDNKIAELTRFKEKVNKELEQYSHVENMSLHIEEKDYPKFNIAMNMLSDCVTMNNNYKDSETLRNHAYTMLKEVLTDSLTIKYEVEKQLEFCLLLKENYGPNSYLDNFISEIKERL